MKEYLDILETEFIKNANPGIAAGQKAYMKNHFEYFGIKSPLRREISKPFLNKEFLPPKNELENIVYVLWNKPEREFQYFAMELFWRYKKHYDEYDIDLMEFMVVNKSWWDSVDMIAGRLMGVYFQKFPNQRKEYVDKWLSSRNLWLQRSAILFQLNYKDKTDVDLLSHVINFLLGSDEFFINKAIGWALRNYSKTNPEWVKDFSDRTELHKLSRREALRLII